ncbi:MAG: filamentous hemagglutinin N-terminal domain-containing protein [Pseudomonadota bacterium]
MKGFDRLSFHRKLACVIAVGILFFFVMPGHAEIATDGTLGPTRSLMGPDFRIGQELGATVGANLFHSFERFNIHSGESATFTGSDTLDNVISRVTGGNVSTIDGLLRSEIGTADFYFINPSGVVFGSNAKVDVPAAFHVGTADELRFAGGSVFSATTPTASTLTAEAPESFGYLGQQTANLIINGSKLEFAPQSSVSFSGGDVTVQGDAAGAARITVPGGELRISAVGTAAGGVALTGGLASGSGMLQVTRAYIGTSGDGGGKLRIGAGNSTLTDATLVSDNTGATVATGGIDIAVAGTLEVNAARIQSDAFIPSDANSDSSGKAGRVTIWGADLIEVLNGGVISSDTYASGDAGGVEIEAGSLRIDRQGASKFTGISSDANSGSSGKAGTVTIRVTDLIEVLNGGVISSDTYASGDAGGVEIEAGSLRIDRQGASKFTGISGIANLDSSGKAGTVTIRVTDLIEVLNGGVISSSTYASGDAGSVEIEAGHLRIDGQGTDKVTGIASQANPRSSGNAGAVRLKVASLLEVLNGGTILSNTHASGDAGSVEIEAGSLRVDRQGAAMVTGIVSQANSSSSGNAGTVAIKVADLLEVLNGGTILSNTFASGDAGRVEIEAGSLRVDGQGSDAVTTVASSAEANSSGNAGKVSIKVAGLLELLNGGQFLSNTYASGDAGQVEIEAGRLRVDGQGADKVTGIVSQANNFGFSGNAGTVAIKVAGLLELLNGGTILSNTFGSGDAGSVEIEAGSLRADGQGSGMVTGVASSAEANSKGNAGKVTIKVADLLEVLNGGQFLSNTFAAGDAGKVEIEAGSLRVDGQGADKVTGIVSQANNFGFSGNAGTVAIKVAGLLELLNGGTILSNTFGSGDAGKVEIEAGSLRVDRQGSDMVTGVASSAEANSTGNAGTVTITVADLLEVLNSGAVSCSTWASGDAGGVEIEAGSLRVDGLGEIKSTAESNSSGKAGTVTIRVDDLMEVLNFGTISSSTHATGDAGGVAIEAGSLRIGMLGRIQSNADSYSSSSGHAGTVTIRVDDLMEVLNSGTISSSTYATGDAGRVVIEAGSLRIDGQGWGLPTGIKSTAESNSSGKAGTVMIKVADLMEVLNSGVISSSTDASGDAGAVVIDAGTLRIDAQGAIMSQSNQKDSIGKAGTVTIRVAELLEVLKGGNISSSTWASGDGGGVEIEAGNLRVDGQGSSVFTGIASAANSESSGKAGTVTISVEGLMEVLNGGQISSSTWGPGNAGEVMVEAGNLLIDGQGAYNVTGIGSTAEAGSSGKAGKVNIEVTELMSVLNGGIISSSTWGSGDAGSVQIHAGEIRIDGRGYNGPSYIASASKGSAQGFPGDVDIETGKLMVQNGGTITIQTQQIVSEEKLAQAGKALLFIDSPVVVLDRGAIITAQSTGNVPAAAIGIEADTLIVMGNSSISTSSAEADGGPITLQGDIIDFRDSLITSSVTGLTGDGGDITIKGNGPAKALILEGGFIQANAPAGRSGGDIYIDTEAVIPEGGALEVGGLTRQSFEPGSGRNIIQAAAPGGEQGTIEITSPELDISGSLVNLEARLTETIRLAADPCSSTGSTEGSSLVFVGAGGVTAGPDQHVGLFLEGERLDRTLRPDADLENFPAK